MPVRGGADVDHPAYRQRLTSGSGLDELQSDVVAIRRFGLRRANVCDSRLKAERVRDLGIGNKAELVELVNLHGGGAVYERAAMTDIHDPHGMGAKVSYPEPIVNHAEQKDRALALYRGASE